MENKIVDQLLKSIKQRKKIILYGEGKNSYLAEHLLNDLVKSASSNIHQKFERQIKVTLVNEASLFTAFCNDVNSTEGFLYLLKSRYESGDTFVLFLESVNENRILKFIEWVNSNNINCVIVTNPFRNLDHLNSPQLTFVKNDLKPNLFGYFISLFSHFITKSIRDRVSIPVIFLDRDGVLNKEKKNYVKSLEDLEINSKVGRDLKILYDCGYEFFIVTNQSAINRKITTMENVNEINAEIQNKLLDYGVKITEVKICPHTPFENCDCRKPKNKMLNDLFSEYPIDKKNSYFIGDSESDFICATQTDVECFLLETPLTKEKFGLNGKYEFLKLNQVALELYERGIRN